MNYYFVTYGLTLIALAITLAAELFIKSTYSKNLKKINKNGLTGKDAARKILDKNGLTNIEVLETSGYLSDHYDPTKKVVRLSSDVYNKSSIASVAVASHECGHAIQDKENYTFMRIRSSLVPIVNFSSYAGYIAIVLGILFGAIGFIWIGITLECIILLFQLITLPVEIDASKRALKEIKNINLLESKEYGRAKTTLTAAALTYVASVATTFIQILRLILIFNRRND